jgi:hypothetical protein
MDCCHLHHGSERGRREKSDVLRLKEKKNGSEKKKIETATVTGRISQLVSSRRTQ